MKRFLFKTGVAVVGAGILISVLYLALVLRKNPDLLQMDRYSIYLFGDSQLYRGVSTDQLSKETGMKTFAVVRPGSGLYNLHSMSFLIPDSSLVVVGFSAQSMIRSQWGVDKGFLFLPTVFTMAEMGWPPYQIKQLIENNLRPNKLLPAPLEPFPYQPEPIFRNEGIIRSMADQNETNIDEVKSKLFISAIENFRRGGCRILLIEFPLHPNFWKKARENGIAERISAIRNGLERELGLVPATIITLQSDSNLFYDYTHVNVAGQLQISHHVALELSRPDSVQIRSLRFSVQSEFPADR